jgi:hypothetical protein
MVVVGLVGTRDRGHAQTVGKDFSILTTILGHSAESTLFNPVQKRCSKVT